MTSLGLAFASLRNRRLRTVLTVFSVAITLAMLCFAVSTTIRVNELLDGSDKSRLSILGTGPMPVSHLNLLRSIPLLTDVEWMRQEGGSDEASHYHFAIFGASPHFLDTFPSVALAPRAGAMDRWLADRQGLLATPAVLARMKWKEGDLVTVNSSIGPMQAHIDGIIDGDDDVVFMHFELMNETAKERDWFFTASVGCPREKFAECSAAIESKLELTTVPVLAIPARTAALFWMQGVTTIPRLLRWLAGLMGILTVIVATTSLSMSLHERALEFGILRALGYQRARIIGLVIVESMTTSTLGGLIGAGLPYLFLRHNGLNLGDGALQNITVSFTTCALGITGAAFLGLLVAIVPAVSTARVDAIRALADG